MFFFFQAEDGIRDVAVTGVQTCALPIWRRGERLLSRRDPLARQGRGDQARRRDRRARRRAGRGRPAAAAAGRVQAARRDRKSTRLNSSHGYISYAVFCLKKKKKEQISYHNDQK